MSKWLDRLREHEKKRRMAQTGTDKTDESQSEGVLSVLSVRSGRESENFSSMHDEATALFEERAAILEYDCCLDRHEAERLAAVTVSPSLH